MIVAGPNARKDYHYNETEELFYQLEGDIVVKTQQNGKKVEVPIKEGEMFLLPPRIPHSPVRSEGSIGLVIERKRTEDQKGRDRRSCAEPEVGDAAWPGQSAWKPGRFSGYRPLSDGHQRGRSREAENIERVSSVIRNA